MKAPRGLKKSKQASASTATSRSQGDATSESMQIILPTDANDAFSELRAISAAAFEAAQNELGERAHSLLRGVIHECNRLLRVTENQKSEATGNEEDEVDVKNNAEFYLIYGKALGWYGVVEEVVKKETDPFIGYLKASMEILREGLQIAEAQQSEPTEESEGEYGLKQKIEIALTRAILQGIKAAMDEQETIDEELMEQPLELLEMVHESLKHESTDELLALGWLLMTVSEELDDEVRLEYVDRALGVFVVVLEKNAESVDAMKGIAACQLTGAEGLTEVIFEDDDVDDDGLTDALQEELVAQACAMLQDAESKLTCALKVASAASSDEKNQEVELMVLLCEVYLQLGSLFEGSGYEDKVVDLYERAIQKDPDCFPADFVHTIEELKQK